MLVTDRTVHTPHTDLTTLVANKVVDMPSSKKFLVPLTGVIATLVATSQNANAVIPVLGQQDSKATEQTALSLVKADGVVYKFAQGNELHHLLVKRNEAGVMMSYHGSHASHASHASHSSHYSSR